MRLIDADALENLYEEGTDPDDPYSDMVYIRAEHIFDAPTIDAEPVRHGEWCGEWERGRYMCSACKTMTDVAEIMGKPAYKFCPWCGSKNKED